MHQNNSLSFPSPLPISLVDSMDRTHWPSLPTSLLCHSPSKWSLHSVYLQDMPARRPTHPHSHSISTLWPWFLIVSQPLIWAETSSSTTGQDCQKTTLRVSPLFMFPQTQFAGKTLALQHTVSLWPPLSAASNNFKPSWWRIQLSRAVK